MKMSGRIENRGVYFTHGNLTYSAVHIDSESPHFVLSQHVDEMPSHYDQELITLDELIDKMREIAPLRSWKNREN